MSNSLDHGQKQQDLRPYIGTNILPGFGDIDDPFEGEVPDDRQGYALYRKVAEARMDEIMQNMAFLKMTTNCERASPSGGMQRMSGKKPEHEGCGSVHACNHVIFQDPVNPEGVEFVPLARGLNAGYFLCKTCSRALQRRRLDMDEIKSKCALCVLETIERIDQTHPDRLVNLGAL